MYMHIYIYIYTYVYNYSPHCPFYVQELRSARSGAVAVAPALPPPPLPKPVSHAEALQAVAALRRAAADSLNPPDSRTASASSSSGAPSGISSSSGAPSGISSTGAPSGISDSRVLPSGISSTGRGNLNPNLPGMLQPGGQPPFHSSAPAAPTAWSHSASWDAAPSGISSNGARLLAPSGICSTPSGISNSNGARLHIGSSGVNELPALDSACSGVALGETLLDNASALKGALPTC